MYAFIQFPIKFNIYIIFKMYVNYAYSNQINVLNANIKKNRSINAHIYFYIFCNNA
jgi:hypothetical protein